MPKDNSNLKWVLPIADEALTTWLDQLKRSSKSVTVICSQIEIPLKQCVQVANAFLNLQPVNMSNAADNIRNKVNFIIKRKKSDSTTLADLITIKENIARIITTINDSSTLSKHEKRAEIQTYLNKVATAVELTIGKLKSCAQRSLSSPSSPPSPNRRLTNSFSI